VHAGPAAGSALDPDPAAVKLHDVLDNGEAEAGSPLVPAAPGIDPVEALENARQSFRGNPRAVIVDAHLQHFAGGRRGDGHRRAGWSVFDGIVEEVEQHLFEAAAVSEGRGVWQAGVVEGDPLGGGFRFEKGTALGGEWDERRRGLA